jgi:hypothetical protein
MLSDVKALANKHFFVCFISSFYFQLKEISKKFRQNDFHSYKKGNGIAGTVGHGFFPSHDRLANLAFCHSGQ